VVKNIAKKKMINNDLIRQRRASPPKADRGSFQQLAALHVLVLIPRGLLLNSSFFPNMLDLTYLFLIIEPLGYWYS
jgi:hypothetical protein